MKKPLSGRIKVAALNLFKLPVIPKKVKEGKWYRLPVKQGLTSEGLAAKVRIRKGSENKLVIMLFGGGVSWNEFMAARPNSIYGSPDKVDFYAPGDADAIVDLAVKLGIHTLSNSESNPFRNWNMIAVPYVTGDFHCGEGDFPYTDLDGKPAVLHHHGHKILKEALCESMKYFGSEPEQILVTGFSAGGFGTALVTDSVMRSFPNCKDVTCYVDSGFMLNPDWPRIAKEVWQAPEEIAARLHSDNITLDSLQALKKEHGDNIKIAFSCSTKDSALSSFVNYVEKDELFADKEAGEKFYKYLSKMCRDMVDTIPDISLFIFDTPDESKENREAGLTKHCVGASDKMIVDGINTAQWLWDAVCGKPSKVGLSLLGEEFENVKKKDDSPKDATFEIMAGLHDKEKTTISFISAPVYNIDDMDPVPCMIDLMFSGCFCLIANKTIDQNRPGMVYINGTPTEAPLTPSNMPMFGQMIGIKCRKYLHEYNKEYNISYREAYDTEGTEIPEFSFVLRTLPRTEPGEKYPEHDEIVLQAAREGAVLLKNDNDALPLGKGAVVNVFGKGAVVFHTGCLGAGKINPRYSIRVKEGIEKYTSLSLNKELYGFYTQETNELPDISVLERAKQANGTAVVFIERNSSEAHDARPEKGHYYLTDEERTMLKTVSGVFTKTVAVLNCAYPIETAWIEEYGIDAVLLTGISGMAGGRALAEILEGTVSPSGRLPNTWAKDYWDIPASRNFLTLADVRKKYPDKAAKYVTTVYEEGLYVGYRYFDTFGKDAAYLFGHGLSYTTFAKTLLSAQTNGASAKIEVVVKNTGNVSGKEVVAVYARIPEGKLEQPQSRLVAFAKTKELAPDESQIISLEISENRLKSYDEETACWIIEKGEIVLYLGNTPKDAKTVCSICIPETKIIKKVKNRVSCPIKINELSKRDPINTYPTGNQTSVYFEDSLPFEVKRDRISEEKAIENKENRLITFQEVVADPALAESFVAQMSNEELARLSVGGGTGWGMGQAGFAGLLAKNGVLEKYRIPEYFFADGNNGVNCNDPNVGFPVSTTVCATWNEELSFREGLAIAREAKDRGVGCLLAPALNLQRNPLCGRHTEYFSEDPFLAGRMAGQESKGFESAGVSSCMKHFFANNAETMRNNNHSLMTERTARELYIAAFEAAFEVNMPDTVMTGYNAANGAFCSDDHELLRGILREELGFDGFVMTDWNGYGNKGMDGALDSGICWLAPGSEDDTFTAPVAEALKYGKLSRATVERNLAELVKVVIKYKKA